jgi:hypothetical protein
MRCPDCGDRWDHCHGTLVLHADLLECTDASCDRPSVAAHRLVVGCGEIGCSSCDRAGQLARL